MFALALGSIATADVTPQAPPPPGSAAADAGAAGAPAPAAAGNDDDTGDDTAPVAAPAAPPLPDASDQAGRDAWLKARIAALLGAHPELAPAKIGVSIVDLDSGDALFEKDPDGHYELASNAKVMTSTAALATLGPEFKWRTSVYAERWDPTNGTVRGDLYLRGRGDPTLRASDLRDLIHDLKLAGVRRVEGSLVFDTSYFDATDEPPHFADQPKERAGFRAPIDAFAIEGDAVVVVVEPDTNGILPATVSLDPSLGDYVEITLSDVTTVTDGRTRLHVETKLKKDKIELEVTGQIRADGGPEWIRRRIDDPLRMTFELTKTALAREGIALGHKKMQRGTVPDRAREMAWHESAPLSEVVRAMNKYSNNFIAETLLKTIGAESIERAGDPRPASWTDGLTVVRRWLTEQVGLAAGSFRIENGSGLFDATDFSPGEITKVLAWAWHDFRIGPDLIASLPTMGVDGTARRRLALSPARGRARAKTGTLAAVATLAGFAAVDARRPLAFALLVNDIPDGERRAARALEDAIVEACVAYLGE